MDQRELRRQKRRAAARRRKYRNRRILALIVLLVIIVVLVKACKKNPNPEDTTSKKPAIERENPKDGQSTENASTESVEDNDTEGANLNIGTRSIKVRNMVISFGHFEHDGNMEIGKRMEYEIPDNVMEEIISTLESSLAYEQDAGNELEDIREDYMVIKLNPNASLEVRHENDFAQGYGKSLQGGEIPSGKYMYVNYYDNSSHGNGSVTSVFLSKENIVNKIKEIIEHHQLEGHEIELGQ